MKLGKISPKAFTLVSLMALALLSTIPITQAPEFEPPIPGWMSFNVVIVEETAGIARTNEPLDVFFYPSPGNLTSADEIRVYGPDNVTEVPSQVYNITKPGAYITSCNVVFPVTCAANSKTHYTIVYNKANPTAPSYSTDLKLTKIDIPGQVITEWSIENSKYNVTTSSELQWLYDIRYKPYSNTTNLIGDANGWKRLLCVETNIGAAWYLQWTPTPGTNTTIVEQGPVFVEVRSELGSWTESGITGSVATFRFYRDIGWFSYTNDMTFDNTKNFAHMQVSASGFRSGLFPDGVYEDVSGGVKTASVSTDIGDVTDWNGTWIDAQDASVGIGFATMSGSTPDWPGGWRSDKTQIAPFLNGTLTSALIQTAVLFHSPTYTETQTLYSKVDNPLTIAVGSEQVNASGWLSYKNVTLTETAGIARTDEPVDVFFKPGAGKCASKDEIRVYDPTGTEIPSQVYNVSTSGGYVTSCNVVFLADVGASSSEDYSIFYNKAGASAPSYSTDLQVKSRTKQVLTTRTEWNVENNYYNTTMGTDGVLSPFKVRGYSETTSVMDTVFIPILRTPNPNIELNWFGWWSYQPNADTTKLEDGPIFADIEANVTDWPYSATNDYNGSGCHYYYIKIRYYANTPWLTASLKYVCNGTVDYDLMLVGIHSEEQIMPWLTRETTTGTDTVNVSKKWGNVTKPPTNLTWTTAWNQTWADFQNTTDSGNDVGLALVNLDGAGTTAFDGLRSADGDEGSPYWNGTCTTKAANLAIGVHTESNYAYAQTLYTRLTKPLNYTVLPEGAAKALIDRAVTNVDVKVTPSDSKYSGGPMDAPQCYPEWTPSYTVNVTVKNNGTVALDTFTVTAYYGNATGNYTIGSQQVNNLAMGASTNVTFTFTVPTLPGYAGAGSGPAPQAWPYPAYTIYGVADTSGDINPGDNDGAHQTITVSWPGDIARQGDGPPDGKVGGPDLFYFARSWYKNAKDHPRYPPTLGGYDYRTDFDMSGRTDGSDLYDLARNWYKGPTN